ncbi:glutamate--tRNA ligase [Candidatus Omnitrophota bacterium]
MTRVRFAPSPTGSLHIGGARTALFNWLYAKSKGAEFILRIEDTDQARSKKEYLDEILDSLKWLGLDWDEVFYQSKRFDLYRDQAQKLLKEGGAYTEKSESGAEAVIFKVPKKQLKVKDLIRGDIEFDTGVIKDQVLIKSDGTPTYNFACVIDDAEMKITQVLRGDDHISNTPKQVLLYEALKLAVPEFAHLPLILGKDGGRLSKRTGATAISEYRLAGYLPQALVNYLLLLSWSPGGNREIIGLREAVELFDLKNVNKTSAAFDLDKLNWMNNQYLKKADTSDLTDELIPLLIEKGYIKKDDFNRKELVSLVKLFQGRLSKLSDFPDWADFFFLKEVRMDPEARAKHLSGDLSREFKLFIERLENLDKFEVDTIESSFREMIKELNIPSKALIHPIRVALTGKTVGPGLFDLIYHLGRDRTRERLAKFVGGGK